CHQIVMTQEIGEEWQRHRSNFARQWLSSMAARRKDHRLDEVLDKALRGRIERVTSSEKNTEAMRKDYRLVEAALATDRIVISLDETARGLFAAAAYKVGELRHIIWVNAERSEEEPIHWLENGARAERKRLLGVQAERGE